ncbi:MAG TPA: biosynthetic-type acetolactate synthase large subunit [Ktedonobacterales bacterium]
MAASASSHQSIATAPAASHARISSAPRPMTGAQILCEALEQEGVEIIFGYPGGTIMPFYDALTSSRLRHALVRHEQAAAHAADGYARATGRVGVCVATSGPGATNLVTGIATAFMDSIPMVAITGQVARRLIGTDAFQETDIVGVTQPITKHSIQVTSVDQMADAVHEAFAIARSGRPGPVLIDVPKDVQLATGVAPAPWRPKTPAQPSQSASFTQAIHRAAAMIDSAERPIILAGHGIILSGAYDELRAFAEKTGAPVVTTLLGISAIPESHPLAVGMPGMHGRASVNRAIHDSDVLIAVGMRFDDRVTGVSHRFAPHARIIHIDIDPAEIGKVFQPDEPIVADARAALQALTNAVSANEHDRWVTSIGPRSDERAADSMGQPATSSAGEGARLPDPAEILAAIRAATAGRAMIVSDVGQHQMWVARHYGYDSPNTHFSSGGLGTMGFALPAAMGAAIGRPDEPIWVVAGDGGIQMNIQELATIVALGLPIKIAIFNNGYLGMVRQWQEFFHDRNYSETRISGPDYEKLAEAYGATGFEVRDADAVPAAIERAMRTDGPVIIDFVIEQEANVYPMVAQGKPNVEMIYPTREARHA